MKHENKETRVGHTRQTEKGRDGRLTPTWTGHKFSSSNKE